MREYGVDGFRVDTAKHVELEAWAELKESTNQALAEWKQNNPDKALDDLPFWMTGEVWAHSVVKSDYFANGFDSIINFEFQSDIFRDGSGQWPPLRHHRRFPQFRTGNTPLMDWNILEGLRSLSATIAVELPESEEVMELHDFF